MALKFGFTSSRIAFVTVLQVLRRVNLKTKLKVFV